MRRAIAVMSHELRNPLGVLRVGLDLLPEHCGEVEALRPMLVSHLAQMIRLVDDLAEMARGDHGKMILGKRSVELCATAREIVRAMGSIFQSLNQRVTVEMGRQPIWLHADRIRILQVIQNLLSNASKYGVAGGTTYLRIGADVERATIQVSEDGIGMDSSLLPVIFVYFTQADSAHTQYHRDGGMGNQPWWP